jgi:hypothetical protein
MEHKLFGSGPEMDLSRFRWRRLDWPYDSGQRLFLSIADREL